MFNFSPSLPGVVPVSEWRFQCSKCAFSIFSGSTCFRVLSTAFASGSRSRSRPRRDAGFPPVSRAGIVPGGICPTLAVSCLGSPEPRLHTGVWSLTYGFAPFFTTKDSSGNNLLQNRWRYVVVGLPISPPCARLLLGASQAGRHRPRLRDYTPNCGSPWRCGGNFRQPGCRYHLPNPGAL